MALAFAAFRADRPAESHTHPRPLLTGRDGGGVLHTNAGEPTGLRMLVGRPAGRLFMA